MRPGSPERLAGSPGPVGLQAGISSKHQTWEHSGRGVRAVGSCPCVHVAAASVPASEPRLLARATRMRVPASQGCGGGGTPGSPDSAGGRSSSLLSK